jgi:RIP metalloprotease RseP
VKIAGMTSEDADVADGYQQSNALRRAVVVVAGPAVNLLVALVVGFVMLFSVGLPQAGTTVARVDPRLGAASAGIRPGDEIVGVNGTPIRSWAEVTDAVEATAPGRDVDITVLRDSRSYRYSVPVLRDAGVPRIGVQADTEHVRYGYVSSVRGSAEAISDVAVGSVRGVGSLIGGVGDLVGGVFGGEVDPAARPLSPIGAVQIGAEIGGRGVFDALQLVLLYSTFLAVFNLLPVPPLDGGRFVIVVIEAAASVVRRRRVEVPAAVSQRIGTAVAVFLLGIGLMAIILDITQPVLQ